ncbi:MULTISPECIES: hypothetical protein [Caproicibacterium]|jgi:ABC-2 type transport system permease protein|uniref:ABC transporter permease n=1 Tax=Caproicibacterium lactatifermentans TaxID=2666138 RepID=A0A859DPL1_9FIRM|nr:hypothetical protein [Caproicibacterium lactatifermentans]ARP50790.1 hypothetical protein B6259_07860 [Ruminococcaceae bacterium CPB6]MDD4807653.1 hypothetical protein [Oscillospiraceae bacterium]QKN23479.1 hypothetical protein GJQ69_02635 [Caproicibacterium lactatifermentans]QKO29843.1 hypothetical protein GKP14_01735 [Caproicibacterium lactatifermentans]
MNHNTLTLLKVQMLGFLGWNQMRHSHVKKGMSSFAILCFLSLLLIFYSVILAMGLVLAKMAALIAPLTAVICVVITLISTLQKSRPALFTCSDYDLVMALPVSVRAVVQSRLLSIYCISFLFSTSFFLPAGIVCGMAGGKDISYWLMLIPALFLLPLLPTAVGAVLSAAITAASVRSRHKNLLSILLGLLLFIAIMAGLFFFLGSDHPGTQLQAAAVSVSRAAGKIYPPAAWYALAVNNGNWGAYLLFALASTGITALLVSILTHNYPALHAALENQHTGRQQNVLQAEKRKILSPTSAFYHKELHRYFSCPVYVLNTMPGPILIVLFSAVLLFLSPEKVASMAGIPIIAVWLRRLAPLLPSMFVCMSCTTAASVSLEGKTRWITCSAPVSQKVVFRAKIAVNLTILLPAVFVSGLLLLFGLHLPPVQAIFTFVLPCIYSLFIAVVGLLLDISRPQFDWTSEMVPVKQGMPMLFTLLIGFLAVFPPILLTFSFSGSAAFIYGGTAVLVLLLTCLLYHHLLRLPLQWQ